MTNRKQAETQAQTTRRQNAVNRVMAELRRGLPVLLHSAGTNPLAVLAAETATHEMMDRVVGWQPDAARIAITASRATALNIRPSGHATVLIPWRSWFDLETVQGVGDATTDLARPLRGPFDREKRAPSDCERAAIQLVKLSRLLPVAIVVPIQEVDITAFAKVEDLLIIEATAIADYESASAADLREITSASVPLGDAEKTRLIAFRPSDGGIEHLAIVIGDPDRAQPVLTRLHSECFTGDLLDSLKCDCGQQLRGAIALMAEEGAGVLLYLAQEGRGIGLMNKLRAYRLQEDGFDTIDANLRLGFDADERVFRPAAEMLRQLGLTRIRLLTNNPEKVTGLEVAGIEVTERVPHNFPANVHNEAYLQTKRQRGGHLS